MNEEMMSYLVLPIELYGNFEKVNSLISKIRARIFYKYLNRNRTFITEEFANLLIGSLPYVPIKGIFDHEEVDFQGHAKTTDGRIYGLVPENPNWVWEDHMDDDGVMRNYVCCDVYIYTGIYPEADFIKNRKLSMELYPSTLRAEWMELNGIRVLKYLSGEFLGLQVLGKDHEPCFEGAGFQEVFTLLEELKDKTNEILGQNTFTITGGQQTVALKFEIADENKYSLLWKALNPNDADGNPTINFWITAIYEDEVVYQDKETMGYFQASYTQNSDNTITVGEGTTCYIIKVTESENTALGAIRVLNNNSFENLDTNYTQLQTDKDALDLKVTELTTQIGTYSATVEDLNVKISDYTTQVDTLTQDTQNKQTAIDTLTAEVSTLNQFKLEKEDSDKRGIIQKYSKILNEDIIAEFTANIASYTVESLTEKLSVAYVNNTPSLFEHQPEARFIPTGEPEYTGAELLLKNYIEKKQNGGNR